MWIILRKECVEIKTVEIKENERIDDLQYKNLKIIQDNTGFCFGIDSVILANFAKNIKKNSKVADLGTGTGILGIILCAKTNLESIVGIEIQEEVAQMANRSIKLNELENKFKIINSNIKDVISKKLLNKNEYDVVITNPPYKEIGRGKINLDSKKVISRHEVTANLNDFLIVAKELLKDKGEFYMVHKPERLVDIICNLRENKLEPKEIKMVYPNKDSKPSLVLIKAIKGANKFLEIDEPLYIYDENGNYTNKIKEIYT